MASAKNSNRYPSTAPAGIVEKENGTARGLLPGVYIAGRHLDERGLGALGGHQFVVAVPEKPGAFGGVIDLGGGTKGMVLGAYNEPPGRLQFRPNARSDSGVLANYLARRDSQSLSLELQQVNVLKTGKTTDQAIAALLAAAARYMDEERKRPIHYPDARGQFAANCLNSNSWAQSLLEHVLGKGVAQDDMPGWDTCKQNRIDSSYFVASAPKTPAARIPTTQTAANAVTYVVQPGDTLGKIANRMLGNANRWNEIKRANPGKIANPNMIRPGEKLVIPPRVRPG